MRLPRAWIVAVLSACLGALVGGGITAIEAASRPWRAGDIRAVAVAPRGPSPRVESDEKTFEFGTVKVGGSGTHEFTIRNAGDAALELAKGATSCTCTVADFDKSDGGSANTRLVPPGASTRLKVEWRGKDVGRFRQQASVITNDPRQPQIFFTVEGHVVPSEFTVTPGVFALPKLSVSTGDKATAKIVTYGSAAPTLTSLSLDDPTSAQFFSLSSAPLDPADVPASDAANGGFLISLEVLPGLPIGPLRQGVRAVLRMPEEVVVEIPVQGSVSGDLALAGAAWDSSSESVHLGTVSSRTGAATTLFLTVRGPHRALVKPTVRSTMPSSLQVVVGEGKPVGSGNVVRIPLSITIPPGSAPANHIGTTQAPAGKIVLDTGHPDSPTLSVPVSVAIGP